MLVTVMDNRVALESERHCSPPDTFSPSRLGASGRGFERTRKPCEQGERLRSCAGSCADTTELLQQVLAVSNGVLNELILVRAAQLLR